MMHATKSTSRASSSTSTSPETSSDFFPLFFCWSHYDSDGCGDQVLHLLLLRPNHAHLLPWLALQHLNEGAQRGTDDNDVSDNLVGPSAVIVYILNLNCCARRLAPCWSSSSRSTLSTSDSRLRSPRSSYQILYFYVSGHITISVTVKVSYITYFDVWAFFCVLPIFFVIWEWTVLLT